MAVRVLGIESSCDETGVALFDSEQGLLAECLHSQIATHARYGGVVPELASRDHIRHLLPLTEACLQQAGCTAQQIDAIAYTAGPGLVGPLLTGAAFARSLAYAWECAALPIHHMEGHLLIAADAAGLHDQTHLALLVSGGHTQLIRVRGLGDYQILGDTRDDAVGEAFDKTAKLLGLSYPGGPELAALAEGGDAHRFAFPRPMSRHPGLDFSFSGLKTFAANLIHNAAHTDVDRADIAAGFQLAAVDTLWLKVRRAVRQEGLSQLVVAGGVAANHALRQRLQQGMVDEGGQAHFPEPRYCTDNGAMIALAGLRHWQAGYQSAGLNIRVQPRWPLSALAVKAV